MKSFILSDSGTGYCHNLKPYVGVYSSLMDTVTGLLGDLSGKGYMLYMDNYYNSVDLCEELLQRSTHTCGTIRRNRGPPPEVNNATVATMKVGEKMAFTTGTVMSLAWRDNKVVRMVSTFHQDTTVQKTKWQKGGAQLSYEKPCSVDDYNQHMNGVDVLDQNINYYPWARRSAKWTTKFVMYLIQISMYNAFVLYRQRNPDGECRRLKAFIHSVILSWTKPKTVTQRAPYRDPAHRLAANLEPLPTRHVLEKLPPTAKRQTPAKRCRVCSRDGKRSETTMQCVACLVPLHKGVCHIRYHTEQGVPFD